MDLPAHPRTRPALDGWGVKPTRARGRPARVSQSQHDQIEAAACCNGGVRNGRWRQASLTVTLGCILGTRGCLTDCPRRIGRERSSTPR